MKGYIYNFDDDDCVISVEELTTCHDCAFYGIAKPNYCGIIKLFIPEESYCSFAQEKKVGNGKPITVRY